MTRGRADVLDDAELQARARELSRAADSGEAARGEQACLVVMSVGRERFGVEVGNVREVVLDPALSALPMAPPFVAGVMNLRGEILGVISLGALLGLQADDSGRPAAVVVQLGDVGAAILADRVDDVAWFGTAAREPVLATVPADGAQLLLGTFRSAAGLVAELNVAEILNHPQLRPAGGSADPAETA